MGERRNRETGTLTNNNLPAVGLIIFFFRAIRGRYRATVQRPLVMFLYISASRVTEISQSTSLLDNRACSENYHTFVDLTLRIDASTRNFYRLFGGM